MISLTSKNEERNHNTRQVCTILILILKQLEQATICVLHLPLQLRAMACGVGFNVCDCDCAIERKRETERQRDLGLNWEILVGINDIFVTSYYLSTSTEDPAIAPDCISCAQNI